MKDESSPGVLQAVGAAISRATDLIQIEFRLAKAELSEKAAQIGAALSLVVTGLVLVAAALILILQAMVLGLIEAGVSPVAATLLVAGTTIAIGLGFVATGRKRLSAESLVPDRTLTDIQRDSALVKEKLT